MTPRRLRIVAAGVRAELVARGTPCDALGADEATIRKQLGVWIPLLRLASPTVVVHADWLVIPVQDA